MPVPKHVNQQSNISSSAAVPLNSLGISPLDITFTFAAMHRATIYGHVTTTNETIERVIVVLNVAAARPLLLSLGSSLNRRVIPASIVIYWTAMSKQQQLYHFSRIPSISMLRRI